MVLFHLYSVHVVDLSTGVVVHPSLVPVPPGRINALRLMVLLAEEPSGMSEASVVETRLIS